MSMAVGRIQAAIWRTEEAIELQKLRIAEANDPRLVEIERHGLGTLEDALDIHRRTLEFMLGISGHQAHRAHVNDGHRSIH